LRRRRLCRRARTRRRLSRPHAPGDSNEANAPIYLSDSPRLTGRGAADRRMARSYDRSPQVRAQADPRHPGFGALAAEAGPYRSPRVRRCIFGGSATEGRPEEAAGETAFVAPGGQGEGAEEHRSERTGKCVSEERRRQRTHWAVRRDCVRRARRPRRRRRGAPERAHWKVRERGAQAATHALAARRDSLAVCRSPEVGVASESMWLPMPCPRTESNRYRQLADARPWPRPRSAP
jgi:hypothetical protein